MTQRELTTEDVRSAVLNEGDGGIGSGWTEVEFNVWLTNILSEEYSEAYGRGYDDGYEDGSLAND